MAGHMDFWCRMVELSFYLSVILPIAGTRWSGQESWRRDLQAAHVSQEDKQLRISLTSDTTTHSETKFDFWPTLHAHCDSALCHQSGTQGSRDSCLVAIPSGTWDCPLVRAEEDKLAGTGSCSIFCSISMKCHIDVLNRRSWEYQGYLFTYLYTFRFHLETMKLSLEKDVRSHRPLWTSLLVYNYILYRSGLFGDPGVCLERIKPTIALNRLGTRSQDVSNKEIISLCESKMSKMSMCQNEKGEHHPCCVSSFSNVWDS